MSVAAATIPAQFKCPISLEIMKDPVTLATGITYDRDSIQRWFEQGHLTCPTTMQQLQSLQLTPNHTLKRLIQGWCSTHNRFSTSAGPADEKAIEEAFSALRNGSLSLFHLSRLSSLAKQKEHNRAFMAALGVPSLLLQIILRACKRIDGSNEDVLCVEESFAILASLPIPKTGESAASQMKETLNIIPSVLCKEGRSISLWIHSAKVLCAMLRADDNLRSNFKAEAELFKSVASMLSRGSAGALKSALDLLLVVSPVRRNRIRVAEAGIVGLLIEILTDAQRNVAEKSLVVIEIVSECAEGRAAICAHSLGVHVLVRKIARVSESATDAAISALWNVFQNCRTSSVVKDFYEAGTYTKLIILLQIGCNSSTKKKAKDILRYQRLFGTNPCYLIANNGINPDGLTRPADVDETKTVDSQNYYST